MGASVGLAAKRAGVGLGRRPRRRRGAAGGRARARRGRRGRAARPSCSPRPTSRSSPRRSPCCPALVEEVLARAPEPLHGHRRRLDEGLVAALPGAVRRRPPGLRPRGARPGARDRRPLRRRDLVPDAGRGHRPRALPARARLRRLARRRAGRDRPEGARPAGRADEPPSARARQPARQPGRRRAASRATTRSPPPAARSAT